MRPQQLHLLILQAIFTFTLSIYLTAQVVPPIKQYKFSQFDEHFTESLKFEGDFQVKITTPKTHRYGNKGIFLMNADYRSKKFYESSKYGTFKIHTISTDKPKNISWIFNISGLRPNRSFTFFIPQSLSKSTKNNLDNLNLDIYIHGLTSQPTNSGFPTRYNSLVISPVKFISAENEGFMRSEGLILRSYSSYRYTIYDLKIKPKLDAIAMHYGIENNPTDVSTYVNEIDLTLVHDIIDNLKPFENVFKKDFGLVTQIKTLDEIRTKGLLQELLFGLVPIGLGPYPSPINYYLATTSRIENIAQLETLIKRLRDLSVHPDIKSLEIPPIRSITSQCNDLLVKLKSILKLYSEMHQVLSDPNEGLFTLKHIKGSTLPLKYKDYINTLMKADLGFMTFAGEEDASPFPAFARNIKPYFGLLVHPFQAFDDDQPPQVQPFHSKVFLQIGVTLGSIEIERIRTNLFNSNNLMVGTGFRFSRSIHLSTGAILYKQEHVNPLIDRPHLQPGFYFSFGIHPNIKTIASSLTGQIFK